MSAFCTIQKPHTTYFRIRGITLFERVNQIGIEAGFLIRRIDIYVSCIPSFICRVHRRRALAVIIVRHGEGGFSEVPQSDLICFVKVHGDIAILQPAGPVLRARFTGPVRSTADTDKCDLRWLLIVRGRVNIFEAKMSLTDTAG